MESGSGLPVVFVHAFPFSREMWGVQVPLLREHFRVVAPDLRGFGLSPLGDSDGVVTVEDHARDILRLMKAEHAYPAALVGLSLGGYVLFEILRRDPAAAVAIVLAGTHPAPDDREQQASREEFARRVEEKGMESVADTLVERLLSPRTLEKRPTLVARVRDILLSGDRAAVAATSRGMGRRPDSTDLLQKIAVPTLVLVGEHDAISPPSVAERMAAKIPDVTALSIGGAGHLANLENPLAFNESIRLFLRERIG
jgi:pimeloyl-ACP methyl ester carboxylesterase